MGEDMRNSLFIGNGLNLTLDNYAWGDMLHEIANYVGTESVSGISLPLEFERLMNIKLARNPGLKEKEDIYSKAKSRAVKPLKELKLVDDAIHHKLRDIPCDSIITTNYDFMIEQVFDSNYSYNESCVTYCEEKTSTLNKVNFYHPHGSIASTKSICLGYEHYVKLLIRIRNEMDKIYSIIDSPDNDGTKWYHKFFTDNLYFVGFGLAESEIDIWSLITKRASLYYRDKDNLQSRIQNVITYYEIINNLDENIRPNTAKLALLEAEHVEVRRKKLSEYMDATGNKKDAYIEAYGDILNEIKAEIEENE